MRSPTRVTISYRGVPVADGRIHEWGPRLWVGRLRALPGYALVRDLVVAARAAERALLDARGGASEDPGVAALLGAVGRRPVLRGPTGAEALARFRELMTALAMRDDRGEPVAATQVWLVDHTAPYEHVEARVLFYEAFAGVPAEAPPRRGAAGDGSRPAV